MEIRQTQAKGSGGHSDDFVLEKNIFNNVFGKDIRRVFIYKKAERLAKALHLVAPAFRESVALRNRVDEIAIGLVDAAVIASDTARTVLARHLLSLSSVLSIARTGQLLSHMNVEVISREVHSLLQEIAAYEEPRLSLDEAPTLATIAKKAQTNGAPPRAPAAGARRTPVGKGHVKDTSEGHIKDRRETILSVIGDKGRASIKDISTLIRGVSEKTIQRELLALVKEGKVAKQGERRWSTYQLAG